MKEPYLFNPRAGEPMKPRLGRCYELAGEIALHNPETTLIHGSIQGLGHPRLAHAWVVLPDDTVWEPASNKVWNRGIFEGFFHPQVDREYENRQAMDHIVRHEHWGPWQHDLSDQQSA